jgi:hypothetical protein
MLKIPWPQDLEQGPLPRFLVWPGRKAASTD